MRNIIVIIVAFIILSSCATTFIDEKSFSSDSYELNAYNEYNIYKRKNKIHEAADTEVYIRNDFELKLPKNIVYWESGSCDFIEYPAKQIIFIKGGYDEICIKGDCKKTGKDKNAWVFRDATENEILNYLDSYWEERGYNYNDLLKSKKNRITKIYTNNITTILLFNIKKENFEVFENCVKTFKYLSKHKNNN